MDTNFFVKLRAYLDSEKYSRIVAMFKKERIDVEKFKQLTKKPEVKVNYLVSTERGKFWLSAGSGYVGDIPAFNAKDFTVVRF